MLMLMRAAVVARRIFLVQNLMAGKKRRDPARRIPPTMTADTKQSEMDEEPPAKAAFLKISTA